MLPVMAGHGDELVEDPALVLLWKTPGSGLVLMPATPAFAILLMFPAT